MTYFITKAGKNILDRMSEKYIAARVKVPAAASVLTELCRLAAPWNAVKCTMKAKPSTKILRFIRHFSFGPNTTAVGIVT